MRTQIWEVICSGVAFIQILLAVLAAAALGTIFSALYVSEGSGTYYILIVDAVLIVFLSTVSIYAIYQCTRAKDYSEE